MDLEKHARMSERMIDDLRAKLARQDALLEDIKSDVDSLRCYLAATENGVKGIDLCNKILGRLTFCNHSEGKAGGEFCEWTKMVRFGLWRSGCPDGPVENIEIDLENVNFCPYCGKPIRLISESFDQRNPHPPSGVIEDGNKEMCQECGGSGEVGGGSEPEDYGRCPACHGTGKKPEAEIGKDGENTNA